MPLNQHSLWTHIHFKLRTVNSIYDSLAISRLLLSLLEYVQRWSKALRTLHTFSANLIYKSRLDIKQNIKRKSPKGFTKIHCMFPFYKTCLNEGLLPIYILRYECIYIFIFFYSDYSLIRVHLLLNSSMTITDSRRVSILRYIRHFAGAVYIIWLLKIFFADV